MPDNPLLIGFYAFIASSLGTLLVTYVNKRGENWATKADIAEITRLAKEIEAKISLESWSHQQRWDIQRAAILEMLKCLADADTFVWRLVHAFSAARFLKEDERPPVRTEADQKYVEAVNAFWRTRLAAEIVCGKAIGDQLQKIDQVLSSVRRKAGEGDFSGIWDKHFLEMQAAKKGLSAGI